MSSSHGVTARRVLLLTDTLGGHSAPAGAAIRRHLASATTSFEVTEIDCLEEFLPGVAVLARLAYTQDATFLPGSTSNLAGALSLAPASPVLTGLSRGGVDALQRFLKSGSFDLVVATSLVGAAAAAEIPAAVRPPVVSIVTAFSARNAWIHPSCDLYFVATKEVREDLVMAGVPYSRVVVSGIPSMVPEGPEPRSVLRKQAGISERFTVVLGGAGYAEADTKGIAAAVAALGMQVVVAPGRDSRVVRQVQALAASNGLVSVADSGASSSAALLGDVVMGRAGGVMVLEAVCAGVPTVIYNPVASQETANVDFLVNAGASLLARDDEDAVEKARYLSNHPARLRQMRESTAGVGTNSAARLVVDRLAAIR